MNIHAGNSSDADAYSLLQKVLEKQEITSKGLESMCSELSAALRQKDVEIRALKETSLRQEAIIKNLSAEMALIKEQYKHLRTLLVQLDSALESSSHVDAALQQHLAKSQNGNIAQPPIRRL